MEEQKFKAMIVWLIVDGKTEDALKQLAEHYGIDAPKISVGLPKKYKSRTVGCYNAKKKAISVLNSDSLKDPFVILHEFYHHTRTDLNLKHRGTERYADEFAREFIQAYRTFTMQTQK